MKPEKFKHLIQSIFAVKDGEILCSKFFELLPRYVDLQVDGQAPEALDPEMSQHLHQCPECEEVYQLLLETVRSMRARQK